MFPFLCPSVLSVVITCLDNRRREAKRSNVSRTEITEGRKTIQEDMKIDERTRLVQDQLFVAPG